MKCPQCGAQVDGNFCPYCGAASQTETPKTEETLKANTPQQPQNTAKSKKPIYKKWWFWVIAAIVIFGMIGKLGSKNKSSVDISEFEWGNLALAEMLPEPESNLGSNLINTEKGRNRSHTDGNSKTNRKDCNFFFDCFGCCSRRYVDQHCK